MINIDEEELTILPTNQFKRNLSLEHSYCEAMKVKDKYLLLHSENVANLMVLFSHNLGFSDSFIMMSHLSGIVHDVGKMVVPRYILNKKEKLTLEEYNIIKSHAAAGSDVLSKVSDLTDVAVVVRHHHERYDGLGYPDGLQGKNIPLFSRMLALCDSYDAMTSNRCYRRAMSREQAQEEILYCSGTQFDTDLAKVFIQVIRQMD